MEKEHLHDGKPELLSIDNMANGAVYEMAGEGLKRLAANIADPNTDATQKRELRITIKVSPYKDRSGAELAISVDTKLAGLKGVDGVMYVARRNGEYLAFGRNTKQEEIQWGTNEAPAGSAKVKAN